MLQTEERASPDHVHAKTYVLTCDLPEKVGQLQSMGLKTPSSNDPFFRDIGHKLASFIELSLPGSEVYSIPMSRLVNDIASAAQAFQNSLSQEIYFVGTCDEITTPVEGHTLSINRLVDTDGESIGLGPRPGFHHLEHQVDQIIAASRHKPLVILEDGSFTGGTVSLIIRLFQEKNKEIAGVILGLGRSQAITKINEIFTGEIIITENITRNIIDWMPDHDFFPAVPNCGKVVGHKPKKQLHPLYTFNGLTFSIPYILPYGPIDEWASIENEEVAFKMSLFCIQKTIELFEIIEQLNGKAITTTDFENQRPIISIPFVRGQSFIPKHENVRLLDYLTDSSHNLTGHNLL